jgi:long-chain acyl-CoA synthetase
VHGYYSGTETCGITALTSQEWLERPGSREAPYSAKRIFWTSRALNLPPGQTGDVYFSHGPKFEHHKDPDKTAKAHDERGWATLGDIGYLDGDGYLFLTDRRNFMIISGGVKTPRRFDFREELPREPTGKLIKAKIIAEYRAS